MLNYDWLKMKPAETKAGNHYYTEQGADLGFSRGWEADFQKIFKNFVDL